ncbi:DUF2163 domain-containing protein [Rhodobacteraceae bacterium CCMM004]|nr:DUF2163 domain-containing protein [Rhodobacteraceae bacterium CCMM004]
MIALSPGLADHLAGGITTLCRCWQVVRRDGVTLGFTDHDGPVGFDGMTFSPSEGLQARALEQTSGLSVDNSEAVGALSDAAVREEDILAGRFDGAVVSAWLVNWAAPDQRLMQFRGTMGEIARSGGAFTAELRGLTEALNQPQGRVYQGPCTAVLGDAQCRADLSSPGYATERSVEAVREAKFFDFAALDGFDDRWFERGTLRVLSGASEGAVAVIKNDRQLPNGRVVEVWEALRGGIAPGDTIRLEAGCDKRLQTCRLKFDNVVNFRGFPYLPSEDWLMAYPKAGGAHTGGSLMPEVGGAALTVDDPGGPGGGGGSGEDFGDGGGA